MLRKLMMVNVGAEEGTVQARQHDAIIWSRDAVNEGHNANARTPIKRDARSRERGNLTNESLG